MSAKRRREPGPEPDDEFDSIFADSEFVCEPVIEEARIIPYDGVVRKNANTIHMAGNMTLAQRRGVNLILSNTLSAYFKQELNQVGLNVLAWSMTDDDRVSRNRNRIIGDIRTMTENPITWYALSDTGELTEWGTRKLFAVLKIKDDIVYYRLTPEVLERLTQIGRTSELTLRIQLLFSSVYTLALYEHARYYLDVGSTPWLSIPSFRAIIGLTGKKYFAFKKLSSRIIGPGVKSINENSDVSIAIEARKIARGEVTSIRFRVLSKAKPSITSNEAAQYEPQEPPARNTNITPEPERREELDHADEVFRARVRLAEYAVSERKAAELISGTGAANVLTALAAADAWRATLAEQGKRVRNLAAVALKATREQWGCVGGECYGTPKPIVEDNRRSRPSELLTAAKPPTLRRDGRGEWCVEYMERLSAEERQGTLTAFVRHLGATGQVVIRDAYRANGLKSRIVQAGLKDYLSSLGISEFDCDNAGGAPPKTIPTTSSTASRRESSSTID